MSPRSIDALPSVGPAVITLGVFDGVHLGHRHVLEATMRAAQERSAASVALVFSPHPDEIVRPVVTVERLLPPEITMDRLTRLGVDHALEIAFDHRLRNLEPEAFLAALAPALELRGITMTPDSAFGRRRAGTLERVAEIAAENGWDCVAVEPMLLDGAPVSSSRIREALAEGRVEEATELMSAPPFLRGTVVHGDERGRELGFPTANLSFAYRAALPALGIYRGRVSVAERGVGPAHPALVSVGVRPTFHDDGRILVEAYLLDWDGDLYDAILDVEILTRLRPEQRFPDADALIAQMRRDEADARRLLG